MYTVIVHNAVLDETTTVRTDIIPRIGDTLPIFCKPYPKVTNVILNILSKNSRPLFVEFKDYNMKINAIVYVK